MNEPYINVFDTHIGIWRDTAPEAVADYKTVRRVLTSEGFALGFCEYTRKHYRSLVNDIRVGSRGGLCVRVDRSGRTCKVEFWSEAQRVNQNGGRYDFDKLDKLPYPDRLRFLVTRKKVLDTFAAEGLTRVSWNDWTPYRDPLDSFNKSWGSDRFRRGPDGWPDDTELSSWDRTNGDGARVEQGAVQYVCERGRWVRVNVFGGINGMWHGYNAGRFETNHNVGSYRSTFPGRGRHFTPRERADRLKRALCKAIQERRFLDAHRIDLALRLLRQQRHEGGRP